MRIRHSIKMIFIYNFFIDLKQNVFKHITRLTQLH